ncbi:hypothetical protein SLA2020_429810 [Shorea laevis]
MNRSNPCKAFDQGPPTSMTHQNESQHGGILALRRSAARKVLHRVGAAPPNCFSSIVDCALDPIDGEKQIVDCAFNDGIPP